MAPQSKPAFSIRDNRVFRFGWRVAKFVCWSIAVYAAIIGIGLLPVNRSFQPAANGIEIYIISNAIHADIIVPKTTSVVDWTQRLRSASLNEDVSEETHVAFGWGDKGFYLETPTWDDLTLSTAANALLLPSPSCLHASFTSLGRHPDARSVTITNQQYQKLVDHIDQTAVQDSAGSFIQIEGKTYSGRDAFFEAHGRYHLLNTCNSWVGRGLAAAGVKVPWLSPLPGAPTLYF